MVALVVAALAAGFEEGNTLSAIFLFLSKQEIGVNCEMRERREGM